MTRRPFAAPGLDGKRAAKKRVLFLTGTRADFGKLKPLVREIQRSEDLDYALFEATSAIGTVGLSANVTPTLGWPSLFLLDFLFLVFDFHCGLERRHVRVAAALEGALQRVRGAPAPVLARRRRLFLLATVRAVGAIGSGLLGRRDRRRKIPCSRAENRFPVSARCGNSAS